MIEFKNVHAGFRLRDGQYHPVLRDINITIKRGEYVAIMGENGSGKTTFAKLCNGLKFADQGTVSVDDIRVEADSPEALNKVRQRVGMVFQNPDNQIVSSTVEREIAFGLENIEIDAKEIENRVDASLRDFELINFSKRDPAQLSGGEKQRLAIAAVVVMRPNYLIFDEPTAFLDYLRQKSVLNIMAGLYVHASDCRENRTIIHITHHPAEALFAKRLIVFKEGKIWTDDEPRSVFQNCGKLAEAGVCPPIEFQALERLKPLFETAVEIDDLLLDPIL